MNSRMKILKVEVSKTHNVTVENRGPRPDDPNGPDMFAVCRWGECLSRTGRWRYEPRPSERTESFVRCTRFPYEEALIRADKAVCLLEAAKETEPHHADDGSFTGTGLD